METIAEAKAHLAKNLINGCVCPCCGQNARVHRVPLGGSIVAELVDIYRLKTDEWMHMPTALPSLQRSRKYPKLSYWGFLEADPNGVPGVWRITEKGKSFVRCEISVPAAVSVYNGQVIHADPKRVSISGVMEGKS